MKRFNIRKYCGAVALIASAATVTLNSCQENIDESNLYTFTGEMMIDHFRNNPEQFSSYYELLGMVTPSKHSTSTMQELLSARGNYTCFAPTNEAIEIYLDSLLEIGEVSSTAISEIPDSVAQFIVYNSIIDTKTSPGYLTTDFSEIDNGALPTKNMNDRDINISYRNDKDGKTLIYVNNNSEILEKDIEVENGYIHTINRVVSPSTASISGLVKTIDNLSFFSYLLEITGWDQKLTKYRDTAYEDHKEVGTAGTTRHGGVYPERRYYGYTMFVEPDSIFELEGINTEARDIEALKTWLKNKNYYADASFDDDYTSEDNAINQFVAYHLLPESLNPNMITFHSNEKGYYNADKTVNKTWRGTITWEYYETMGKHRRTMKITNTQNGRRINRHAEMNLVRFVETNVDIPGIAISNSNGTHPTQALNGYYYILDEILTWNEKVSKVVLNERMRYDICSLLPEMMTMGFRQNRDNNRQFTEDYFDNIVNMDKETKFVYLPNTTLAGGTGQWLNFQIDEFNIMGKYDFTMKLPPVPESGTYEIRYGVNANGNRGMAQVYIGENPNNLAAVGIPLDLRIGGDAAGRVGDANLSTDEIDANDKALRNNGYMKGPKYFYPDPNASGRDCVNCLRRIIYTGQLDAGKTYYIRFKSVLESDQTEFFFDYLEIVPKSVYNGDIPEDKW